MKRERLKVHSFVIVQIVINQKKGWFCKWYEPFECFNQLENTYLAIGESERKI